MNKIASIHQPHYFPWLGYLDKMVKADEFIILDDVQLTDRSPMVRNKFLQLDGQEKYLSLSVSKKGYREKKTREVELTNWSKTRKTHSRFLELNYKKTPFYDEIMPRVAPIFEVDFRLLIEVEMATVGVLREIFAISTPMVKQSELNYDRKAKNNELMLSLCNATGADGYLSGRGAKRYMIDESFQACGVIVRYQEFKPPTYPQYRQRECARGLSALDLAFQCGVEGAREVFYSNMKQEDWS